MTTKGTAIPEDESVELTDEQLGILVRRLLGPPEEWDDVAAKFGLEVYGIDPSDAEAARYVKSMLDKIVREKKERGEPIPQMLLNMVALYDDSPPSTKPV
jgi:hypothetical protein